MMKSTAMPVKISLTLVFLGLFLESIVVVDAFNVNRAQQQTYQQQPSHFHGERSQKIAELRAFSDDSPSDYDPTELIGEKKAEVDLDENDSAIRDEIKRELLLLASVTERGQYASKEEKDIIVDLVNQLEALNPTSDPASNCDGDWDLCLSSTPQLFRSSPFFQSIRVALGEDNKNIALNGFILHDRATTASRVGRVRQVVSNEKKKLTSYVDLTVAVTPGLPFRVKGTVVTSSALDVVSSDTWELKIETTEVTGSNIPLVNQLMDDMKLEVPVGDLYQSVAGKTPVVPMKTFYVDESVRISRDIDENFYLFTRA